MHEWLEALRKSAKATSEGVLAEEVRRAETESGVPFPVELADLYQALNGGEFQGEVHLYPLSGGEGAPSVLEESRLTVVGLPAAGLWRFGLKGAHRHLFVARKSAMEEQGDGGGPLPGWVDAMDADAWVFGTWEGEKQEMRLYRTLKDMLEVLIPPVEEEESFGERTFARAMNAVLQGALSGVAAEDEEQGPAPGGDYASGLADLARDASEDEEAGEQGELFTEPETKRPAAKKPRAKKAAEAPAPVREAGPAAKKGAATSGAAKKAAPVGGAAKKGAVKKGAAKKAPSKATAKKGAAKKVASKATAKKGAAKKVAGKATARKTSGKATAKKGAARKVTGRTAAKKGAAKKSTGKATAKKSARRRS
jgi:hypothetical protein